MKNFKNAGFERIESMWSETGVVVLLHACTVKELDKFFVCSKMSPADFSRLIENLRPYATTEDTQAKVDELEEMYPVATETESTPEADTTTTTEDTTETTTTTTTEESAPAPTYTYRELQAQVKALKAAGLTNVKLNAKREVLEAAIAQAQAQAPAPAETTPAPVETETTTEETTETTEDTYYEIDLSCKGMATVINDLHEMDDVEAVIRKALGRPTKQLIKDFDLDPSLKRSEVKAILTDAIKAVAEYVKATEPEEPTESAPVEETPAPVAEEAPTVAETETTLEVVEVKEVTPVVAPKSIIPEGYKWSYVKYNWGQFGTKEEAIDFALEDERTMGMSFHDGATIEEWMLAQVADCACLATLQSRLEGVAWDMMILYPGYRGAVTNWLESHKCPVRNDAKKDVNYMMSLIWKNTILPDFQEAYPEAWAAVTEEA